MTPQHLTTAGRATEYAALIESKLASVPKNPDGSHKPYLITKACWPGLSHGQTGTRARWVKAYLAGRGAPKAPVSPIVRSAEAGPVPETLPFKAGQYYTIEQASNALDRGPETTQRILQDAQTRGLNVVFVDGGFTISKAPAPSKPTAQRVAENGGWVRFGALGDNHLCSRYERLDVLNSLYDRYAAEGIETVYNTGNWIDGEARFNVHDLNIHGFDRQINYFLDKYPQRPGIETFYIGGDDHEGWYTSKMGIDAGQHAQHLARERGRTDLSYLGYMEADVELLAPEGKTTVRVLHPGGGSSYAISYTSQKIVESLTGNEKPDVMLVGHYHKAEYLHVRGVHVVQTGCTQDQSPFMRKKRLSAHLGGWIIEFKRLPNGAIERFRAEFFPYYDGAFYQKWKYQI